MGVYEIRVFAGIFVVSGLLLVLGFVYWRYVWFFRNPPRNPPPGMGILSPADGTVVYASVVEPEEDVITIKRGARASVNDIVREHLTQRKVLIGIFMSPFDVHFNRAPLSGQIQFIRHYPAVKKNVHMGSMHLRTVLKLAPLSKNSLHIVQNERTIMKIDGEFKGDALSCYVIQIAGGSVRGIDSYVREGESVERGVIFGMIRIGSQVDLIVPLKEGMKMRVHPGRRVRAGETVLIEMKGY
jgi:phosphatidylserine decarboxylase